MVLHRIRAGNVPEQSPASGFDGLGHWWLSGSTANFEVSDMCREGDPQDAMKTPLVECIEPPAGLHSHVPHTCSVEVCSRWGEAQVETL